MDIDNLLKELTLEEKVALCAGSDAWHGTPIPRLDIPALKMTDGPNGARGNATSGKTAASFPVGSAMASTWNTELIGEVGRALGQEVKSKGAQILLGPTINLHRTPLGGRNFECFSEDPYLTGELAIAFVKGVQSEGVGACVKHFVCNESEYQRHFISSDVDERTLRELYLLPFEMAINEAKPWSVMSSYNRINGVFASSNEYLLRDVLKGEWNFDGLVVSDWGAALETAENAVGGLDLEMPGPTRTRGDALVKAVQEGSVSEALIDDSVRRILDVMVRAGKFEHPEEAPEEAIDLPEHRDLARRTAEEGMVLIRNEGILPLQKAELKRIAVIGPNAKTGQIQGGGSSVVLPHYQVMPLDALQSHFDAVTIDYEIGCTNHKYIPVPEPGLLYADSDLNVSGIRLQMYAGPEFKGDAVIDRQIKRRPTSLLPLNMMTRDVLERGFSAVLTATLVAEQSGDYQFGLLSAGLARALVDGETIIDNWDEQIPGDSFFGQGSAEKCASMHLQSGQHYQFRIEFCDEPEKSMTGIRYGIMEPVADDSIERAVAAAATADAVILMAGSNPDWETEGNDRLDLDLPGEQNLLIERVLAANSNTVVVLNNGGTVAMPWLEEAAAVLQVWLPGQEFGNALVNILTGTTNPSARMPTTIPRRLQDTPGFDNYPGENGHVQYGERMFMGYRWYDTRDIEPLIPFGHGLSYTQFEYSDLELAATSGQAPVNVTLQIKNTGNRAGKEVVQIYVHDLQASVQRPDQELKAFRKIELDCNEAMSVELDLPERAFAFWDEGSRTWRVEPGEFEIRIGASSRDIRLTQRFLYGGTG
jgi:beta-glucosidase